MSLAELAPAVLARALEPFPVTLRTLDGLHLSTVHFLASRRQKVALATYDARMRSCAGRLGLELAPV